jgi:hypothetical protein
MRTRTRYIPIVEVLSNALDLTGRNENRVTYISNASCAPSVYAGTKTATLCLVVSRRVAGMPMHSLPDCIGR